MKRTLKIAAIFRARFIVFMKPPLGVENNGCDISGKGNFNRTGASPRGHKYIFTAQKLLDKPGFVINVVPAIPSPFGPVVVTG